MSLTHTPGVEAVPRAPAEVVGEVGRGVVHLLADHLRFLRACDREKEREHLSEKS